MPVRDDASFDDGPGLTRELLILRAMQEDHAALKATTRPAALSHRALATLMRSVADTMPRDGSLSAVPAADLPSAISRPADIAIVPHVPTFLA